MTPEQHDRLDFLQRGACVPTQYIDEYYGLEWPLDGELANDYSVWRRGLGRRRDCPEGMVSRYELEAFMHRKRVIPTKWMAARLGMTQPSFRQLASRLPELGLRPGQFLPYREMAFEDLAEEIIPTLPGLRFRTFSDHNGYCTRLQAELRGVLDGIEIEPLFCTTADTLEDYPRQFACYFDCVTLAPVSPKHQMWLDFRKPIALTPDRCSKLFYAENRDALQPFLAGTAEPADLDVYQAALEARRNG